MIRGETTIELRYPIMRGEEEVTSVTIRRPTGKDMRLMDQFQDKPMGLTMALIEQLSGLTRADVDRLDGEDIERLGECVFATMPSGRKDGETP